MPYNGSGTFLRIRNWVNDATAGIKIRADRHDSEDDNFAQGLSQCITKDGQTTVSANLPMSTFRHTGTGAAASLTDYARYDQVLEGKANWVAAGGTADAITASYGIVTASVVDGQLFFVRAGAANATATPTFSPNGQTARTIVKENGVALVAGDISGAGYECIFRYDLANTRYVFLNPRGLTQADVAAEIAASAALQLPVGSIYHNDEVSTNPATLLGYGVWTAIQDRVIIGASGTYAAKSTGGSATTTQTESTMAAHTHSVSTYDNSGATGPRAAGVNTGNSGSISTNSTGGGSAMTTISPYYAAYTWRRAA